MSLPKRKIRVDWDRRRFEHLRVDLRPEVPVRAWRHRYPGPQRLSYDVHYSLEFGVVYRGQMLREYRDAELALGPGEAWLCGTWEPHAGRVLRGPTELLVFAVLPEALMDSRFAEARSLDLTAPFCVEPLRRPNVPQEKRAEVLAWAARVRKTIDASCAENADDESRVRLRLALLEGLLLVQHGWAGPPRQPSAFGRVNPAIELVLSSRRSIPTREAARACAMSRSRFDRVFADLMGVTFARFELRHRVHGAAGELLRTDRPLKAIAADWGFADAAHLHRRFVEIYGHTPAEHRQAGGA